MKLTKFKVSKMNQPSKSIQNDSPTIFQTRFTKFDEFAFTFTRNGYKDPELNLNVYDIPFFYSSMYASRGRCGFKVCTVLPGV